MTFGEKGTKQLRKSAIEQVKAGAKTQIISNSIQVSYRITQYTGLSRVCDGY